MGTPGVALDPDLIVNTIYAKKGIVIHVAAEMGCCPEAIYKNMKKHPEIKVALDDARAMADEEKINRKEYQRDLAFNSIELLLQKNDIPSTIFILKTLCGYNDKDGQQAVQVTINDPLRQRDSNTA
jgi:hypothetical protein